MLIAIALNLLTAGALWGNLSSRIGTIEREMRDVKRDVKDHGDLELLVERCVSELRAMRRDMDSLLGRGPGYDEDSFDEPKRRRSRYRPPEDWRP